MLTRVDGYVTDCGDPSPAFGSATVPGGTLYGHYALVMCDAGYELNGTPSLVCLHTGFWSSASDCKPVGTCPKCTSICMVLLM